MVIFQHTVRIQLTILDCSLIQRGCAHLEVPTVCFCTFPHKNGVRSEQWYEMAGCLPYISVAVERVSLKATNLFPLSYRLRQGAAWLAQAAALMLWASELDKVSPLLLILHRKPKLAVFQHKFVWAAAASPLHMPIATYSAQKRQTAWLKRGCGPFCSDVQLCDTSEIRLHLYWCRSKATKSLTQVWSKTSCLPGLPRAGFIPQHCRDALYITTAVPCLQIMATAATHVQLLLCTCSKTALGAREQQPGPRVWVVRAMEKLRSTSLLILQTLQGWQNSTFKMSQLSHQERTNEQGIFFFLISKDPIFTLT